MTQNEEDPYENSEGSAWTVTFVDLMSLMLTFFVLLFSMNTVQSAGWESLVDSMKQQFSVKESAVQVEDDSRKSAVSEIRGKNVRYLATLFENSLKDDPLFRGGSFDLVNNQLVMTIPAENIFLQSDHLISPDQAKKFIELGIKLAQLPNNIIINGISPQDAQFLEPYRNPSEKAIAMARSVAAVFDNRGVKGAMTIIGREERSGSKERIEIKVLDEGVKRGIYEIL
ncbi:flagellar motor protein MotB [Temperatibacter marinus]|uniref:Flagellar motor protein MotB n=1 Tax=Temperatibacter marinus TaxID=1456591 RepID=A0AA52H826_9PROT|nr:flagellar motor protein MotB [Temperatibacter marinus]WND01686.1 flagellar motor protein MotB [Temperatibacter marinus]